MGIFAKISDGLKKTRDSMSGAIDSMLKSFKKIDDELYDELEEILIMSDVGVSTAEKIIEALRQKVKEEKITDPSALKTAIRDIVKDMLSGGEEMHLDTKPSVILMIGVNGAGKTTTIGKLALKYKNEGKKVILGAADTFRAAAIEQLEVWAQRAGVQLIKHAEGADPAAVVFDTIAAGKARGEDIIICDTAGRLQNKKNLMDELNKISRIIERELPDADKEVLLVLDATTGQNAVSQARLFKEAAGITGIVLTKLDGTARGGVVIAIREELQIPVKYIGVGEGIDDLQLFNAEAFADALFSELQDAPEEAAEEEAEEAAQSEESEELAQEISQTEETEVPEEAEIPVQPAMPTEPETETQAAAAAEPAEEPAQPQPEPAEEKLTFVLASQNEKKLVEMRRILEPMGIDVVTAAQMGFTEDVEETGTTFEENSLIKARAVCDALHMPAIADDSGLCVDALGGAPGVYSARYAGEMHDDTANMNKLLDDMFDVPKRKRSAHYMCAITLVMPDGRILTAQGKCEGTIGYNPKGNNGFGYDPIFKVGMKTMAQLDDAKKDAISHRGKALRQLKAELPEFLNANTKF
ncbi:MAG: signal recognition particle-docking protein FtsY [Clostridia bacterium]|nr:signal recognition particle-docking protein FtsY [Clostridia bacterium]